MADILRIPVNATQSLAACHGKPPRDDEREDRGPDEPLIVMVHTFPDSFMSGHDDLFGRMENALTLEGYHTLRFDFRGYGMSDGRQELMSFGTASQDLAAVLHWARERGYKRFVLIAEGLAMPVALTQMSEDMPALILLWPVLDTKELAARRFHAEELRDRLGQPGFEEIDGHKIGLKLIGEMWNTDLPKFFPKIKIPVLVLHGVQDSVSPVEHLDLIRSGFRTKRIEITTYQDGTHGLPQPNHRKYAHYHILQFLKKYA